MATLALTDESLFADLLARRAAGEPIDRPLAQLVERWRRPAAHVVGRIQASYGRGSPADADEVFQEALGRLLQRGLDQFRGLSERHMGEAASPRTFFLRIVKHLAIDLYRRQREDLAAAPADGEEREEAQATVTRAVRRAAEVEVAREASETYREAFQRLEREHPNEAAAWALYHHEDMEDHPEVARRLGISVVNSYKRVSRAQAYLRSYLLEQRTAEATAWA